MSNFQKFSRGLANHVYKCYLKSDTALEGAIVVRVYGFIMHNMSLIRTCSPWVWILAHKEGLGVPVYATFTNGLVYGYAQGSPLTNEVQHNDKHLR